LFEQIKNEINLKKVVPSAIANATSNHAIHQATLKEFYTSSINIWNRDIYNKSLCNVIQIILWIHLAPERMARYQKHSTEES
ncbi:10140_t:CDS:1, partial [Entrophospora sp. SA101]